MGQTVYYYYLQLVIFLVFQMNITNIVQQFNIKSNFTKRSFNPFQNHLSQVEQVANIIITIIIIIIFLQQRKLKPRCVARGVSENSHGCQEPLRKYYFIRGSVHEIMQEQLAATCCLSPCPPFIAHRPADTHCSTPHPHPAHCHSWVGGKMQGLRGGQCNSWQLVKLLLWSLYLWSLAFYCIG